jgi:heme exporter protein D
MAEFFAMGGHGAYVWSAYGITLVVLVINGWMAVRRHRKAVDAALRDVEPRQSPRQAKVRQLKVRQL